jgi:hypothetical protein
MSCQMSRPLLEGAMTSAIILRLGVETGNGPRVRNGCGGRQKCLLRLPAPSLPAAILGSVSGTGARFEDHRDVTAFS